jgi:CO/xanthine dehydrogenase FAD-binding subunit
MLEQQASGFAIAGVAVVIGQPGGGSSSGAGSGAPIGPDAPVDDIRVAVTGVGDYPYRATSVEDALRGTKLGSAAIGSAAIASAVASICDGITVQSDIHADRTYRSAMAGVMAQRALEAARERLFD